MRGASRSVFDGSTLALPVDFLRVACGLLTAAYFAQLWLQTPDISSPDGLIDHAHVRRMFWFTTPNLFELGLNAGQMRLIFAASAVASISVAAGWRPKPFALLLYIVAVSAQRWNFLVMYVDDAIIHLLLFWMILLPVGRTLVLTHWMRDRKAVWGRWKTELVPGFVVRCFVANLALIYLVAGLWKWSSPLWRDGAALYAVLRLPISYAPGFWNPEHEAILVALNYAALTIETLVPLIVVLPAHHWLKYSLWIGLLGFHAGIIATLKIPFANLACIAASVLFFRDELAAVLNGSREADGTVLWESTWARRLAAGVTLTLTLAMLTSVTLPPWRQPMSITAASTTPADVSDRAMDGSGGIHLLLSGALWQIGLAQQYQLFNWIDARNFAATYDVVQLNGSERVRVEVPEVFPPTLRGAILQGYMHGLTWANVPSAERAALRRGLYTRHARRFCRSHGGDFEVRAKVTRVTSFHEHEEGTSTLMMRFACEGAPRILALDLVP